MKLTSNPSKSSLLQSSSSSNLYKPNQLNRIPLRPTIQHVYNKIENENYTKQGNIFSQNQFDLPFNNAKKENFHQSFNKIERKDDCFRQTQSILQQIQIENLQHQKLIAKNCNDQKAQSFRSNQSLMQEQKSKISNKNKVNFQQPIKSLKKVTSIKICNKNYDSNYYNQYNLNDGNANNWFNNKSKFNQQFINQFNESALQSLQLSPSYNRQTTIIQQDYQGLSTNEEIGYFLLDLQQSGEKSCKGRDFSNDSFAENPQVIHHQQPQQQNMNNSSIQYPLTSEKEKSQKKNNNQTKILRFMKRDISQTSEQLQNYVENVKRVMNSTIKMQKQIEKEDESLKEKRCRELLKIKSVSRLDEIKEKMMESLSGIKKSQERKSKNQCLSPEIEDTQNQRKIFQFGQSVVNFSEKLEKFIKNQRYVANKENMSQIKIQNTIKQINPKDLLGKTQQNQFKYLKKEDDDQKKVSIISSEDSWDEIKFKKILK